MAFPDQYWSERYETGNTKWDIGYPSTPLQTYIDQLKQQDLKILIPGCGNAYEAEYLMELGFTDVTLLDISKTLVERLKASYFPKYEDRLRILHQDFFDHQDQYDLILEQTFFCSLLPSFRAAYSRQMHNLLKPGGTLAGVLFQFMLTEKGPPFGGSKEEYLEYFNPWFHVKTMEDAYNSITPRIGSELFFILNKL